MPFTTAAIIGTTATTTSVVSGVAITSTVAAWGATAATIAADAALVAGGVGAFSQIQAGHEAEELGKSQNEIAAYNAMLDKREAEERLSVAGVKEQRFRTQAERLKARQRVGFAKAGVSGVTPMDTLEFTAIELETEALGIRREGQIGFEASTVSAGLRRVAGRNALIRGRNRSRAANIAAIGSAIGGLGQSAVARQKLS